MDDTILPIDPQFVAFGGQTKLAAVGLGDAEPAKTDLVSTGVSLAPLAPVHPRVRMTQSGDWEICWSRRARGQWRWADYVDAPLVEETESYVVGIGPETAPYVSWQTAGPILQLSSATIADISSTYGMSEIWARQIGTHGASPATHIHWIS